jgi:hypothetical protein
MAKLDQLLAERQERETAKGAAKKPTRRRAK